MLTRLPANAYSRCIDRPPLQRPCDVLHLRPHDGCSMHRDIEFKDVNYEEPTENAAAVEAMADAHPLEADF